jgi:hypothetical protein
MKIRITPSTLDEKRKKKKKKKKKSGGKKDACYHKVRSRYSVWPSAYASGALVKCRKVGAKNWGTGGKKKKKKANESIDLLDDEGGAAGLDPLEDAVKDLDLPEDFDIDEFLEKMEDVIQHEAGDYIEKTGLDEAKKKRKKRKKKSKRKKAGTESSKESSLRDWFGRKGAKGKKKGWVDCNAPDGKGGYKACGRSGGEKRKKYPACRPTPGACKERGKGKSWGKKAKKKKTNEAASDYVYGVKNPGRVGNIYKIRVVKT